jgi:hypothetical protein
MAMNSLLSGDKEIAQLISEALPELRELALREMQRRIEKYDLKVNEELLKSFKAAVLKQADGLQHEIMLSFRLYGRYKDLRYVAYDNFSLPSNRGKKYGKNPDNGDAPEIVKGMEDYIKRRLSINQLYVPGYDSNRGRKLPTSTLAIRRLAWTMAMSRLQKPRVKNRKRGWYNEARGVITNKAGAALREKIRGMALNARAAQAMGKDIIL